jgi:hypothetical protein
VGCAAVKPWAQRALLAAAVLTAEALAGAWAVFAVTLPAVIAVWLWRLRRHPMGPCWSCRGRAGRNPGSDATQWGRCARCLRTPGGAGEEPRLGAVLMHPELRRK